MQLLTLSRSNIFQVPLRQELCLRGYGALDAWGLLLEYFLSTGSNGGQPPFAASHDLRAEDVGFDALQTVAGGPRQAKKQESKRLLC